MANIKDPVLSADVDTQHSGTFEHCWGNAQWYRHLKKHLATCETNVYHVTQQFHKNMYPCKDLYVKRFIAALFIIAKFAKTPNSSQLVGGKTSYGTSV